MIRWCLVGLGVVLAAGPAAAQLPPRYPTTAMPSMTEWPAMYSPYLGYPGWGWPYYRGGLGYPGWQGSTYGGALLGPHCMARGNLLTTFLVESEKVPLPAAVQPGKGAQAEPGPVKLGGLKWRGPAAFVDVQGRQWRRIGGVPTFPLPDELTGWALTTNDGRHMFYTNNGQVFILISPPE